MLYDASIFVCSSCVLRLMMRRGQHGGEARHPHVPCRGHLVACNYWCHLVSPHLAQVPRPRCPGWGAGLVTAGAAETSPRTRPPCTWHVGDTAKDVTIARCSEDEWTDQDQTFTC